MLGSNDHFLYFSISRSTSHIQERKIATPSLHLKGGSSQAAISYHFLISTIFLWVYFGWLNFLLFEALVRPVTQLKPSSKQSYPQAAPSFHPFTLHFGAENKTRKVGKVWTFVKTDKEKKLFSLTPLRCKMSLASCDFSL